MTTFLLRLQATVMTLMVMLFSASAVQSSVIINSTRIVYPQNDKEVTIRLESKNLAPVLIQVWMDNGDDHSTPQTGEAPFVATPPIFRMEAGKQQVVRLAYTGEKPPSTQEELFWFNVLEVPSQSPGAQQTNQLQIAFRSRIKLFLRPPNLPYGVEAAPAKLQWRAVSTAQGQALEVFNPTPYYMTFEQLEVLVAGQRHARKAAVSSAENSVAPGARNRFEFPNVKTPLSTGATIEFQTLDDFGVKVPASARVPP